MIDVAQSSMLTCFRVPTILTIAGADMSADEIDVNLDGTPITFPLQDTADFERNDAARGETTHLEYWGYVTAENQFDIASRSECSKCRRVTCY